MDVKHMGVMRMGFVQIRVTDMDAAKKHYMGTLGMRETAEQDGKVYLKGWDEWDHHSVVLEPGGVGAVKFGFKVESSDHISSIEKAAQTFGASCQRVSRGDDLEVGDGIQITAPSGHVFEIYNEMAQVGGEMGYHNPNSHPRDELGVCVPNLDHALITASDVALNEKFFMDVLGFYPTEQVLPELDSPRRIATWLTAGQKVHDIAILEGPDRGLHHFAFEIDDWGAVLRAADIMAMDDVSVEVTPTRHGITRGKTIYFFDPSGNRNETFAGGYRAYPDRPCIQWTAEALGRGIFYHSGELVETFSTALT
jgi:catechol 2,3-dioxygenase